jgi:hypothetical protein
MRRLIAIKRGRSCSNKAPSRSGISGVLSIVSLLSGSNTGSGSRLTFGSPRM